jgi:hypothetical protein
VIILEKKIVNGISLEQIQGMTEAVKKQPQMAQGKLYAKTVWKSGFNNEASINDFMLGGAMNTTSRKAHSSLRETIRLNCLALIRELLQWKCF